MGRASGVCLVFLSLISSACSLSSYSSLDGLVGTAAGAIAGAGVGQIIGDQVGKKTENTAIAAGVGAASGLLIGSLIHENRAELSKEKSQVIREAKMIDDRTKEIEELRKKIDSDTSWGRSEARPWNDRYVIEVSDFPYQGSSLN